MPTGVLTPRLYLLRRSNRGEGQEGGISMPQFPAVIQLSSLDGSNGFKIDGSAAGDYIGREVSSAGDLNLDGYPDVIIAADHAAYVVFGKLSAFVPTLEVSSLNGGNGFRIPTYWPAVAAPGDVNGDGFGDLLIGYPFDPALGTAYVVFGKATGFPADLNLSGLNGSNGFQINPPNTVDLFGASVSSAGDINGDGFDDLIIGAPGFYYYGGPPGTAFVVFGKASGFGAVLDLSGLNGTNGFKINPEQGSDYCGWSVASGGDINGDGFTDVIVSAPSHFSNGKPYSGAAYVLFGKASGFAPSFDLASVNGSNGFRIDGVDAFSNLGWSISLAGDVNGDGIDDFIVATPRADSNGYNSGAAYVVFGKASFGSAFDLSTLNGSNGFKISGEAAYDYAGSSVSSGDVNADGYSDIIVGAPGSYPDPSNPGATYVVFGRTGSFSA